MPGNWYISVSAPGYEPVVDKRVSIAGPSRSITITLSKPAVFVCKICKSEFPTKAAHDKHLLEKHTWVMVNKVEPPDAELVLDDRTPIRPGEKKPVKPGPHWITGESSRGYLKEPYEPPCRFTVEPGKPCLIDKITVPDNALPAVIIGRVEPAGATITVNGMTLYRGKTIRPGTTVNIKPEAGANSVKFNVTVTADDCKTWTQEKELKWKDAPWQIPDPLVLPRRHWADVRLRVDPAQIDAHTKVWLEDAGVRHELKHGPEVTRLDLGDAAIKAYSVRISPPPDYREKNAGQKVTLEDQKETTVLVELVKNEGRLKLSFDPKPVAAVSVYGGSGVLLKPAEDGSYVLAPEVAHHLVCKAEGFEDCPLPEFTLRPGENRLLTARMNPKPGVLKLKVDPSDATIEITDAAGKIVTTDTSGTTERTIKLSPGEDGSDKAYRCKVTRYGFVKDLLNVGSEDDVTIQRGKTVSLRDTQLKPIKDILQTTLARDARGGVIVENNRPAIKGGLAAEELEAAAGLATHPSVKDVIVWGALRWRDMPKYYREKAGKAK